MTEWHHHNPIKLLVPESMGILISSTVGAGIFGLPFVFAQAGFLTGLLVLVVLALSNILINLLIGEMSLSTKEPEQLVGLGQKYLGSFGKIGTFITLGIGIYGALLAYLIGEGQVLSVLSGDGRPLLFSIIFFIFAGVLVYLGLDFLRRAELWLMGLIFMAAVIIVVVASPHLEVNNLMQFDWRKIFLAYGATFFALLGGSAVPSMRKVLVGYEKHLKKAIIWGSVIPVILYIVFTFIAVGVAGLQTTEIATVGLGDLIGRSFLIVSNIFAALVMGTSFLTLGV
ncbi:MAG: hypothetical protein NTV81_00595, partial [Candidatus Komeilibacteria bacterium]|nr:hypothetical protein [Candidatus Komeilibacteria bacterium]